MREIKFRAWSGRKMIEHVGVIPSLPLNDIDRLDIQGEVYLNPYKWNLMQYTGLKDRNGKKIFEGDICRNDKAVDSEWCFEIYWSDTASFEGRCPDNFEKLPGDMIFPLVGKLEIIGNIYENPELLKIC